MRLFQIHIFLLFFLINVAFIAQPKSKSTGTNSDKIALIVALSQYADDTGWSPLNADNDIPLVRHALISQGFNESDIKVIENRQATKKGILEAIEIHLIQKAKRGGVAVLHFTGHGQQIQDDNGDELDGLDEALVPYDSPLHYKKGIYEGENLLRDDELGDLLLKLRRKLGKKGQVLVILDACHSGTGTRGLGIARGTDVIMGDSTYINNLNTNLSEKNSFDSETPPSNRELAPMVSFFGSSANQLNYETINTEGQSVGSLSYAFSQAFVEAKKESSYRALFEQIRLKMSFLAPNQTPQSEGDLDVPLLGGQLLGKVNYFKIAKYGWESETRLRLDGGTLSGLFPGTTMQLFPPDTRNLEQNAPLTVGKVIEATPFSAIIELENPISKKSAIDSWVFIQQQQFGNLSVPVQLDFSYKKLEKIILENISEYPVIQQVKNNPQLIVQTYGGTNNQDSIRLLTTDEKILYETAINGKYSRVAWQLVQSILAYVQCNFLRSFDMKNDQLNVHMEIIPVKSEGISPEKETKTIFNVGEKFKLRISNNGIVPVYFTVIDIQPDNKINIIIPASGSRHTPTELYLQSGQQLDYQFTFEVKPPYGTEVFKLIATLSPIDLSPIVSSRGDGIPEDAHPFEKLFSATYLNDSRGQTQFGIGTMIHVDSKIFEIQKKEDYK